jgi:peptidoglycan/LPS O-acetylase OafA/YrhL
MRRSQASIDTKHWRTVMKAVFGLIPISVMGFGVDPFMGLARDQWHLGFWQREAAYALAALLVIVITVAAWITVDRRLFEGASRGAERLGR